MVWGRDAGSLGKPWQALTRIDELPEALLSNLSPNAATRGFNKSHGMALDLVYRVENRCNSSGAPAGASPRPPRGWVGLGSGPKSAISGPTPLLIALE